MALSLDVYQPEKPEEKSRKTALPNNESLLSPDFFILLEAKFLDYLTDQFLSAFRQRFGETAPAPDREQTNTFLIHLWVSHDYRAWFQKTAKSFPSPEIVFDYYQDHPELIAAEIALQRGMDSPEELYHEAVERYAQFHLPEPMIDPLRRGYRFRVHRTTTVDEGRGYLRRFAA